MNPYIEIITAAILWGSSGVFVKYLNLPATTISFFRLAVPTLILAVYFIQQKQKLWHPGNKWLMIASTLNATRMFFYFLALSLTSIGNAVIILYTWPLFVAILSIFFLKERTSRTNVILMFTAFLGIVFIYLNKHISFGNQDFVGMSAMLLSAFIYSFTVIIYKKQSTTFSRLQTVYYQNLVGAFVFLPFLFFNHPAPTLTQTSVATVYAILIGLVGFGLFFSALKKINASTAASLAYIEVVSALIFGMIFFSEPLTWNTAIGGLLIVGSTMLMRKTSK